MTEPTIDPFVLGMVFIIGGGLFGALLCWLVLRGDHMSEEGQRQRDETEAQFKSDGYGADHAE